MISLRIAVVEKITSFELRTKILADFVQKKVVSARELDKIKQAHDDHQKTLDEVLAWLQKNEISFERFSLRLKLDLDAFECVITVGGDGTLLAVSHQIKNPTILLGVRSSGTSVGFLCCCDQSSFATVMERLLKNTLKIATVDRVSARITHAGDQLHIRSCPALNDILYTNENPAATTRYIINLNGKSEAHHSSGIWLSTAAGSTAGIFSAGGQQMDLEDPRIQYCVRELYTFQNRNFELSRGFIDLPAVKSPAHEPAFFIENRCDRAVIALDGQEEILYMEWGDKVEFMRDASLRLAIA